MEEKPCSTGGDDVDARKWDCSDKGGVVDKHGLFVESFVLPIAAVVPTPITATYSDCAFEDQVFVMTPYIQVAVVQGYYTSKPNISNSLSKF